MTFEEFWLTLLPAEVDELKPVFEACWIEAWTSGAKEEREACAKLAMTEAALQHELDTVRNPRAAVMHSPDAAKWKKMAAMIRMRSNSIAVRAALRLRTGAGLGTGLTTWR